MTTIEILSAMASSQPCACKACRWLRDGGSREPPSEVCPNIGEQSSPVPAEADPSLRGSP